MNMNEVLQKCVQLWLNYSNGFFKDSDRGNIIIGGAILDELFKEMILTIHHEKLKVAKKFIDHPGPLSSFGNRIDYLFLTGYIDENTHWALHKFRELRNFMAHESSHLTFESQPVKDKIATIAKKLESDQESISTKFHFHGIIVKLYLSILYSFFESYGISKDQVLAKWDPILESIKEKS